MAVEWADGGWTVSRCPEVMRVLRRAECEEALRRLRDLVPVCLRGVADETPAKRVAREVWEEETIVDKGLPIGQYLREAAGLPPRVVSRKGVGRVLGVVVSEVSAMRDSIIGWRAVQQRALQEVADSLQAANAELMLLVPEHGRIISKGVNFAFLYVACEALQYVDGFVVDKLLYGFEPVGEVPAGGRFRPIDEPAVQAFSTDENRENFDMVATRLEVSARRAIQKGSDSKEWQDVVTLWENVTGATGEVAKGHMDGGELGDGYSRRQIWEKYADCPGGPRCLLRFGVEQGGKLRGCDDAALCGHNDRTQMHETIHCIGADFPAAVARAFANWDNGEGEQECAMCWIGTDDVEAAYRKILNSMPQYTVVALWSPVASRVRYFLVPGFPFGLKSAVVAFNRVEEFLIEISRVMMLVACGHYYDDTVVVEPKFAGRSGQRANWFVHSVAGIPLAEKKHERMRSANPFLGIVSDFASRRGYVIMRVKEARRRRLLRTLQGVLDAGVLSGAQAASIRGKLYFTSLSAFGGVGRAPLQALARRQYGRGEDERVDDAMREAIMAMRELLANLPPRAIPLVDTERVDCIKIWSDAMWDPIVGDDGEAVQVFDEVTGADFYIAEATLAFAVYKPWDGKWVHSYRKVDLDIIRQMVPGKKTDIGQLEALAAAAVIYSLPEEWLAGRDGYMWIDNMGAKYSLQKGGARKEDSARIVDAFAKRVASIGFRPWFEYVPSAQNVADLPSRGKWAEYYAAIGADAEGRLPSGELASEWVDMKVPDVSGWSAVSAVGASARTRKRRRGR